MIRYMVMLQRAFVHLSLILLFAFTQMGVVTHAVSHIGDEHEHHQQESDSAKSHCEQCLSFSHATNATPAATFQFQVSTSSHAFTPCPLASDNSVTATSYSARAPPLTSQT